MERTQRGFAPLHAPVGELVKRSLCVMRGHPQTPGPPQADTVLCHSRGACPREDGERESSHGRRVGFAHKHYEVSVRSPDLTCRLG